MGKVFDSSYITPSLRGALSVRLVIEGTIIIIVPLIASFLLDALSLLVPAFDLTVCISTVEDVAQITVIPTTPSAMLLRWSETTGQVPGQTLPVVRLLTPVSLITVEDRSTMVAASSIA
jgi:hypothetical protein